MDGLENRNPSVIIASAIPYWAPWARCNIIRLSICKTLCLQESTLFNLFVWENVCGLTEERLNPNRSDGLIPHCVSFFLQKPNFIQIKPPE